MYNIVDSKVGRLLFYSAIQDLGIKKGKCVILVTHQHQFTGDFRCILMSAGSIACIGSFEQCVQESKGKMILAFQNKESEMEDIPQDQAQTNASDSAPERSPNAEVEPIDDSTKSSSNKNEHKEMSNTGIVKKETFIEYLKAMPGGSWTGFLMLVLFIVTQGCVLATIAVVGVWSNLPGDQQSSWGIISIVIGLVLAVCVFAIVRAFLSFFFTVEASKRLHDQMTRSVLRSKIEFFDVSMTLYTQRYTSKAHNFSRCTI
jgi:hypothetical protein